MTARELRALWKRRLDEARRLRAQAAEISDQLDNMLLHPKAGLRREILSCDTAQLAWGAVVQRCRKQVRHAAARLRAKRRGRDRVVTAVVGGSA